MPTQTTFESRIDGTTLATYDWGEDLCQPRGIVQIAHGLGEHAARYDRLAQALVAAGYRVHANDHRGHGRTAASEADFGSFGAPGFSGVAADLAAFGAAIKEADPGLPLFLIAHSMGSFAAQEAIVEHSAQYAGVVLSGTTSLDVLAANLAQSESPAGLEAFNVGFEHRTGYEWLSRDESEVDKYVADPLCGFDMPDETIPMLFGSAARLADPAVLAGISASLPVLLVSGQHDPIAGDGQLIELLGQRYRDAGLTDVTVTVYPEARHEIFNETNRDEITSDVIAWLDEHA